MLLKDKRAAWSRSYGMKNAKIETLYVGDTIVTKDWKKFTILNF